MAPEREQAYKKVIQLIRQGHEIRNVMESKARDCMLLERQYLEIRKEVERIEKEYDL